MSDNNGFPILQFTRKERRGIGLLVIINVLIIFFPEVYIYFLNSEKQTGPEIVKQLSLLKEYENLKADKLNFITSQKGTGEKKKIIIPFEFDPNTINGRQWKQLGIDNRVVTTIMKYLSKGGRFRRPEDLKKIWGIPQSIADTLIPYVRISAIKTQEIQSKNESPTLRKNKEILELNTADSAQLEALPGIGPSLAHRIIAYRVKIRGYYHIEQLREVWGIRDSVYNSISRFFTVNNEAIKRIDINTAGIDELKSHPYFGYWVAKSIVEYRNQHGFYNSLEDVQKILSIDEENFKKISHYLIIKK